MIVFAQSAVYLIQAFSNRWINGLGMDHSFFQMLLKMGM